MKQKAQINWNNAMQSAENFCSKSSNIRGGRDDGGKDEQPGELFRVLTHRRTRTAEDEIARQT
jgi:hypothetical protein